MPTTVNGVGTTYFGKRNLEQYPGVCQWCNNATTLSDYETGYWICLIFIPVIPLGRRMILNECPVCTRHSAISLREWERVREASITDGIHALSSQGNNPEKALELLGTYTAFKQYDQARELAVTIKSNNWNSYDVLLAVAGWFDEMGMQREADECFDRCLKLDYDCPASKHIRCITHIQEGELIPARELATEMFNMEPMEKLPVMSLLADAFEQSHQLPDAYELHKMMLGRVPELRDDKEFCKHIRKIEQQIGVFESVVPKRGLFGWFG